MTKRIGVCVLILLVMVTGTIYLATSIFAENTSLPSALLENYNTQSNDEKVKTKSTIIKNIMQATKNTSDDYNIEEANLSIVFGDLMGNGSNNAVITLQLGEKNTIIVVYKLNNDKYEYAELVGTFFKIEDLQIMPIKQSGKNILVVREKADQLLGAFEIAAFIRGYVYNSTSGEFELVLNVLENYKAYWNELWDNPKNKDTHWLKISQNGNVKWDNGINPTLTTVFTQTYGKSEAVNLKSIPEDGNFDVEKTRQINEKYFWSDKWNHFILFEARDSKGGEIVAVIEDMSSSPFNLTNDNNNTYRVKYKNGKVEIVEKSRIKPTDKNKLIGNPISST